MQNLTSKVETIIPFLHKIIGSHKSSSSYNTACSQCCNQPPNQGVTSFARRIPIWQPQFMYT
uniref:Putative ovule protein n=1 Tax=Solanum chacoense TaxID=4108 RepID=A0A0V0GG91_SOLCH